MAAVHGIQMITELPPFIGNMIANIFCHTAIQLGYKDKLQGYDWDKQELSFFGTDEEKEKLLAVTKFHLERLYPRYYESQIAYMIDNNLSVVRKPKLKRLSPVKYSAKYKARKHHYTTNRT